MRLLVLDDDLRLAQAFAGRLRDDGFDVDEVATMGQARVAIAEVPYDCLVLDRLVPDGDALDLVAEVHQRQARPWMLVLSALGDGDQRVRGLEAGADDYLPKPVRLEELALRVIRLVLRPLSSMPRPVRLGRVTIDRTRREALLDGRVVHLTPTQYAVLEYLVTQRDRMVTTEELLDHCWDGTRDLFANPAHSQVSRLRSAFRGALRIESLRGTGYVLRVVEPDEPGS